MRKRSRKQAHRRVTLEVSASDFVLVVRENNGQSQSVRGHRIKWLDEASSLQTREGQAELADALVGVVAAEKLHNATVNLALSSDLCVTRVVACETDKLRGELRALRDRCGQYLLLGAGKKAIAESTAPIDAKQTQAWLTVTNSTTLNHLVQAVSQAGLHINLIEHDMVSICRAVGQMGYDTESPVIIVEMKHRGVDLGVSYKGQLLFDYRPGGVDCRARIAEIVQRHLERIQRYCTRQFRFAKGEISKVYLCGPPQEVETIRQQFEQAGRLSAEILMPQNVVPEWQCSEAICDDPSFFAAVGASLVEDDSLRAAASGRGVPNLMDYFLSANRAPLWPTLARNAWPVAAALLLALGVYGAASFKHRQAAALEGQLAQYETELGRIHLMRLESDAATTKLSYLKSIRSSLMNPGWHQVLAMVGQSMPQGVWLDSIRVEQDGSVAITGPGASEDVIFDFVRYLKRVPVLNNVNLESQQPVRLPQGPAIKFDIKCEFNDWESLVERTASNG